MKRIALIFTILFAFGQMATAQEGRETSIFIGAGTGLNFGFDGSGFINRENSHNGAGYAAEFFAGAWLNEPLGLRLGYQGFGISDRFTDFNRLKYNYFHGDVLFRPHRNIVPYIHAGYVKIVNPSFGAGVGLMFPIQLGRYISIVPDLKATGHGSYAYDTAMRNLSITLSGTIGLAVRFGGRTRHVEPVDPGIPFTVVHDTVTVKEIINTETVVRDTVYLHQHDTTILHPEKISALALFDTDKSVIRKEAYPDLNKIVAWFSVFPEARAVIEGHTDSQASAEYNQALSERRAKAVYDYLVEHGVAADRLTWVGYGLTIPVDTNDTPEGRQRNRRVEIHVE